MLACLHAEMPSDMKIKIILLLWQQTQHMGMLITVLYLSSQITMADQQ